MKLSPLLLLLIVCYLPGRAQETVTFSTNPTYLKWYQINTDHFKVLYPQGFEQQGQRMANTLEHIYEPEAKTLGVRPRKISIVLQNQSSTSNGFVTLAPRRSEFYAMPSQNYNFIGTLDWLDLLATHEYRHIVQYQRSITGFNKLIYTLFGEQTLAAMSFANTPQWFWEGDAVATETAFTHSGRGRIPNFDLLFRTNFQEGRTFNYHKQYLRSYKHNMPDHYVLGYHMISYLRKKTGDPDIWGKISKRSWSVPFIPFRFSNSIRAVAGMNVTGLFKEMATDLTKDWKQQTEQLTLTAFERINPRFTKAFTDYLYPQVLEDGSVVAMKSGIGDISQLVRLTEGGKEEKGFIPGPLNSTGMLSVANYRVVWNEYRFDPRWQVKTYSIVKAFDFEKNKSQVISKQSRYGGAALSPDGTLVATVETDTDYKTRLVVLDSIGNITKAFANTENDFISMARFADDGNSIVAIRSTRSGKAITRYDLVQSTATDITPLTWENIGYPVLYRNHLLYNSPYSGIDNIYAMDIETGKRFQITSSKYGAYNPAVSKDGRTMYYNEQTRDGMDVVKIPFDPFYWKPIEEVTNTGIHFYDHLAEQEGKPNLLDTIPTIQYETRKYNKLKGIFNPHSWGPFVGTDLTQVELSITSQDVLSTTRISGGYMFDINERTGSWQAEVSYQGLYPIIDFNVKQGRRSVNEGNIEYNKVIGSDTTIVIEDLKFKWKEKTIEAGLRLPLITTQSKFSSNISALYYVGYTSVSEFENSLDGNGRLLPANYPQYFFRDYVANGNLIYNRFALSASNLLKRSGRDINSKWGQSINLSFYNTPYKGSDYNGQQFSFYGIGYFPGLAKHHSLWGYWAYQQTQIATTLNVNTGEGLDNYFFRNGIPLPRGVSVGRFQKFYSMSGNYTLPLWYPDIAIGPLLNIQRIRANVFFDYGFGSTVFSATNKRSQSYSSTGAELKFDINIMRFLPQVDVGFRYSYGIDPSVTKFELLIGTFNF